LGPSSLRADWNEFANSGLTMPVMNRPEARKLGLDFYWTGTPCNKGHYAKRRTINAVCSACLYLTTRERALRGKVERTVASEERTERGDLGRRTTPRKSSPQEEDALREKVLAVYAETGSLELAAKAVSLTLTDLNVHIARNVTFATQIYSLEKRMKAVKEQEETKYSPKRIKWNDEKYDLFIRAYVDTGNIAAARDAVGASASDYFDELNANSDFADRVKDAHPKAAQALEEKAIQLALLGNDKLLGVVLKAKLPEYKDKIQIEQTNTTYLKLPDQQLNKRIADLLSKYGDVIEGEIIERPIEPAAQGTGTALSFSGRTGEAQDEEQA